MTRTRRVFHVASVFDGRDALRSDAELFLDEGVLVRVLADGEEDESLRRDFEGAEHVRVPDGIAMPGLVNAHHHAYSALARGLPVDGPLPDFPTILAQLWWRYDRALDEEVVRLAGLVTAMDSIRCGVTTVVDHHSSPSCIPASLGLLDSSFARLGLARVLCYETTDRNGIDALHSAIATNVAHATACAGFPASAGLFGLHASFTLSEDGLARIAAAKPPELPVHVHVAEDRCDVEHAMSLGYDGPLARLDRFGLLTPGSLVVHGVHLSDAECDLVRERGAYLVHNPESNLNNAVGYADLDRLPEDRILLGTDGMGSSVLGSLRAAFLQYAAHGGGVRDALTLALRMGFANPATWASRLFDRPVGRLVEGEPADLAIFPYPAPTPVTGASLAAHLVYGLAEAPRASWVYARGVPVLEDGAIPLVDEAAIRAEAREHAAVLWRRYEEIR
jgi:cytosine/adenosine deaminase-related metal-dependent hydrolase